MQDIAKQGVAGAGESLPHLDQIQRAFGAHDVSHIRAHVGADAAGAAQAIGAEAYTHGANVALRDPNNLHVVAHEAAPVVQQRAGVQLADGVDQPGDEHERNADAVAERVVRGESAADLLSPFAGSKSNDEPQVQRFVDTSSNGNVPWDKMSDDGRMAVKVRHDEAWVAPDMIPASNKILDQNRSRAKIETGGDRHKVKVKGATKYIQKIKMVDREAGWLARNFGDDTVNLTDDCGAANGQMMGADTMHQRAFRAVTAGNGKQEYTNEASYRKDDLKPDGNISTTEELSGQIYVRIMQRELNQTCAPTSCRSPAASASSSAGESSPPRFPSATTSLPAMERRGYSRQVS